MKSVVLVLLLEVRQDPEVSGAVLRLVAFPEVRVHREVVPHRVLPLVVVGREVGVAVTESEKSYR